MSGSNSHVDTLGKVCTAHVTQVGDCQALEVKITVFRIPSISSQVHKISILLLLEREEFDVSHMDGSL